jgi:hypothetical protein
MAEAFDKSRISFGGDLGVQNGDSGLVPPSYAASYKPGTVQYLS